MRVFLWTTRRWLYHNSSLGTGLFMAMLPRRTLFMTLIQVGAFFLVCYLISRFFPGQSSSNIDLDSVNPALWTTSTKCPNCIDSKEGVYHNNQVTRNSRKSQHDGLNNRDVDYKAVYRVSNVASDDRGSKEIVLQPHANKSHSNTNPTLKLNHLQQTSPECKDPLCTEYLTEEDMSRFNSCLQKVRSHSGHPQDGGQCHFMPQTHRAPVALASYPGSGNTWLRGLLETATGICTGFEFCDISMRVKGFAGENIVSGAVSVVKTHGYPHWNSKNKHGGSAAEFDSAVVLVRNPLDALVAEWNRRVANDFRGSTISLTSHVKSAGQDMFGTNPKWAEFLQEQIPRWQSMMKDWITSHGRHAILVVKYEDLQKNATLQVKRILTFLQIPYKDRVVNTKLAEGFDSFHRTRKPEFEHYTPGQQQRVLRAVDDTIRLLSSSRLSHLLDIHDYLQQT